MQELDDMLYVRILAHSKVHNSLVIIIFTMSTIILP